MPEKSHAAETPGPSPAKRKGAFSRFLPMGALVIGLAAFFLLGGGRYLGLDTLAARYEELRTLVGENRLLAAMGFAALYAALVAISVPGAASLTIAAGLLFGPWLGGGLVVVGATTGALIVFLAARTAFADTLARRAGPAVQRLREGFERDAFNYLLFLRLVPAFPFFLVNIAAGLFGMRTTPYVLATAIGIVPGTFVYAAIGAGAGAVIARGESIELGGVLSDPAVLLPILGLGLLALLPVILRRLRKRRTGAAS